MLIGSSEQASLRDAATSDGCPAMNRRAILTASLRDENVTSNENDFDTAAGLA
jgi:hypothetical protein